MYAGGWLQGCAQFQQPFGGSRNAGLGCLFSYLKNNEDLSPSILSLYTDTALIVHASKFSSIRIPIFDPVPAANKIQPCLKAQAELIVIVVRSSSRKLHHMTLW